MFVVLAVVLKVAREHGLLSVLWKDVEMWTYRALECGLCDAFVQFRVFLVVFYGSQSVIY